MSDNENFGNENENNGSTMSAPKNNYTWILGALLLISMVVIVWLAVSDNTQAGQSEVVKTVNGEVITKDMLYNLIPDEYSNSLVEQAIQEILINQEAKKANITVTDEEVQAAVDEQIEQINTQFTPEQLNSILAQQGLTMDGLTKDIEKNMPMQLKLEKLLGSEVEITDEEIKTYYEENKDSFNEPKSVRASHILVESKELAETILQELQGGADFAELAAEHSIDPGSKANGGDLDYFTTGMMVEPFEEAAFALSVGEISEVVETENGFHIIKVTDIKEAKEYTFEEKQEEVREILFDQKLQPIASEFLAKIREDANIK